MGASPLAKVIKNIQNKWIKNKLIVLNIHTALKYFFIKDFHNPNLMSHTNTKHGNINYGNPSAKQQYNQHQQQLSQFTSTYPSLASSHQNLDVVDMSEDDTSVTSVKGEGFASDLSDNESRSQPVHLKLSQRTKTRKPPTEQAHRRPTTPMDIHQKARQNSDTAYRTTNAKFKKNQGQGSNENVQQPTGRFNEWDPFNRSIGHGQANPLDRKKSPHNTRDG